MDLSNGAQHTETRSYNTDWIVIVYGTTADLKHVSRIPADFPKTNDII